MSRPGIRRRIMLQLSNDIARKRVHPDRATLRQIGEIDLARPLTGAIPHPAGIVRIRIDAHPPLCRRSPVCPAPRAHSHHLALQRRDTRCGITLIERRHAIDILPAVQMTDGDTLRREPVPVLRRIAGKRLRLAQQDPAEAGIVADAVIAPVELTHQRDGQQQVRGIGEIGARIRTVDAVSFKILLARDRIDR